MIVSASRRTDIPAFHAAWMMNRLREGFVCVRNPHNPRQVSRVSLRREDAEAIVFWTKDASNLLPFMDELDGMGYPWLFQYTLTPYGREIEKGVDKRRAMAAFERLAARRGAGRMIWRYDPILLTDEWTPEKHLAMFERMCARMEGMTGRCVISFVDLYASVKRTAPWISAPDEQTMRQMAREMAAAARRHGMIPSACAEQLDFTAEGLEARGCIDRTDMESVLGAPIALQKDTGQRTACRCVRSVDIGTYDTCGHGCAYCYARTGRGQAVCNADSPVLGGVIGENDRVTERREKPIGLRQRSMFD